MRRQSVMLDCEELRHKRKTITWARVLLFARNRRSLEESHKKRGPFVSKHKILHRDWA